MSEIQLRVGDARQRDVGRGIARIDQQTMQRLGISAGDAVEVVNKRTTSAIAWPAYNEDQNKAIVRIDGFTRKNSDVAINEYVIVRLAEVKTALNVTLAPVEMRLNVDEDFTNFVRARLMERTMVEGDTTLVMMLGHAIPFTVRKTNPTGVVKVTADSKLLILNEPNSSDQGQQQQQQKPTPLFLATEALRETTDDLFDKAIGRVMAKFFFDYKQFNIQEVATEVGTTPELIQSATQFLNSFVTNNFCGDLSVSSFQRILLNDFRYPQSKVDIVMKHFEQNKTELRNSLIFWFVRDLHAKLEVTTKSEYISAIATRLTELKDLYGHTLDVCSSTREEVCKLQDKVDELDRLVRTNGSSTKDEEKKRKLW